MKGTGGDGARWVDGTWEGDSQRWMESMDWSDARKGLAATWIDAFNVVQFLGSSIRSYCLAPQFQSLFYAQADPNMVSK